MYYGVTPSHCVKVKVFIPNIYIHISWPYECHEMEPNMYNYKIHIQALDYYNITYRTLDSDLHFIQANNLP